MPAQGDLSKQLTKTPVSLSSKAQPLCTTLNKSQLVENRITRAAARFSKVLVTFGPEIKYSNQNIKNKGTGPAQQTTSFCFTNWQFYVRCKTIETSILHVNNKSFNYRGVRETGPRLVVKATCLFEGPCLTTPDDYRRQLKKLFFFFFFFLLRHWTLCLLKQLTFFVQSVLRSVLWLKLLGFHWLLSAHCAMKFFLFSFLLKKRKKERCHGRLVVVSHVT